MKIFEMGFRPSLNPDQKTNQDFLKSQASKEIALNKLMLQPELMQKSNSPTKKRANLYSNSQFKKTTIKPHIVFLNGTCIRQAS